MANKEKFTRRDFIQAWGEATCGSIYLPSLASLLYSSIVHGGPPTTPNCSKDTGDYADKNYQCSLPENLPPAFIALDLAGGAGIPGNNVMVYKDGGEDLLNNYSQLVHSTPKDKINSELGLDFHEESGMLTGIKEALKKEAGGFATIAAKVNGCVICTKSSDDTKDNPLATAPGIFLATTRGKTSLVQKGGGIIVPLIGNKEGSFGDSGGNSRTGFASGVAPTLIKDVNSAMALLTKDEIWHCNYTREKALETIKKLSGSQLDRFSQLSLPQQAKIILENGYADVNKLLNCKPKDVSYANEKKLKNTWYTSSDSIETVKQIAYMILKGFAGSGTITIDGYDYHDGSASKGYMKDIEAGKAIGTILKMANTLNRKLMLHVYTDGGVSPSGSETVKTLDKKDKVERLKWTGDSEVHSADFVLVFDPAGRVDLNFKQMGGFKDENSSIDLSPARHGRIADSPENEAHVVVANWLAWAGESPGLMANNPIRGSELDDYLFIRS